MTPQAGIKAVHEDVNRRIEFLEKQHSIKQSESWDSNILLCGDPLNEV
jgi:predicted transglutaminase-like cysteine proteinase